MFQRNLKLLYLPMYNAHPYFEACFQKKSVLNVILIEK